MKLDKKIGSPQIKNGRSRFSINGKWNKSRAIYYLSYTAFFFLFFILTFHTFFIEKRSFVWESDGLGQYIVNLYALYSRFYDGIKAVFNGDRVTFPIYSFNVGFGADVLGSYFVTISEYLGLFFKRSNIELVYNGLAVFKMYVSGLTFSWLCRYFKRPYLSTLVGTLIYVFSGFTLYYGIRHQQFIIPMILLPCFIVALDKIINGKSPIYFCLLVFYSTWLDYYFLYVNTIILGIYFLVRYLTSFKQKSFKGFCLISFKIVYSYLVGVGMAFIPFVSKLQDFINSPRTKNNTIAKADLLWYGEKWIGNFVSRLFAPYTQSDYINHYMLFSLMALVLPILVIFFMEKRKKYKALKIWVLLSILFFIFPIVGFIFSGFNATINRWSYGFVLLTAFVTATILPSMEKVGKNHVIAVIIAVMAYLGTCVIYKDEKDNSVIVAGIVMLITLLFVLLFIYLVKHKKRRIAYSGFLLLMAINLFVNGEYVYSESKGGFASEFVEANGVLARFTNSLDATASNIKDDTFYRTELYTNSQFTAGFSKVWQYNGTSLYASTNNRHIIEYGEDVENSGFLTVANIYNFDGRSFLEALGSVKYYITPEGHEKYVPYGFKYKYSKETGSIINSVYENTNHLPLGYTFSSVSSERVYNKLNALERQEAMLQTAFVDDGEEIKLEEGEITYTSTRKKYKVQSENVEMGKNSFVVKKDGATIEVKFNSDDSSEKYIEIKGLNIDGVTGKSMPIEIFTDDEELTKGIWVPTTDDFYKLKENNYLINLGSKINGEIIIHIKFPYKGVYNFKEFNVYEQSTRNLKNYISNLKHESLKNIVVQDNLITGNISVSKDKMLCFSIPYNKGWRLSVDGQPVKMQRVNKMYMGAVIPKGNHEIKLMYVPQNYELWCTVTIVSFVCFGFMLYRALKRKNKD